MGDHNCTPCCSGAQTSMQPANKICIHNVQLITLKLNAENDVSCQMGSSLSGQQLKDSVRSCPTTTLTLAISYY